MLKQLLKQHPQKITGFVLVVLGSVQASSEVLRDVLTPTRFAVMVVVLGAIVAGLGFVNTQLGGEDPNK